mgnify:CR=1 FL=1
MDQIEFEGKGKFWRCYVGVIVIGDVGVFVICTIQVFLIPICTDIQLILEERRGEERKEVVLSEGIHTGSLD